MRPRELFYYYLCDYSNQNNFYVDNAGRIQTTNVPTRLKYAPQGWLGSELKFSRSQHYYGLNRSYTIPLKFVEDGAAIIRNVFYTGKGIEQLISLVVLKWDPDKDAYFLYYRGLLDLSKMQDNVQDGVTVNVMEGGVVQLLKAYENAVFEIPCDGSISENIKVNCDGILFNDVFHYSFIPFTAVYPGEAIIPAIFNTNDGDNIGIIKGNPTYEQPSGAPYTFLAGSSNYLFSSIAPLSVTLTGSIAVKANPLYGHATKFYLYIATSLSQPRGVDGLDHAIGLVKAQCPPGTGFFEAKFSQVDVNGNMVFNFSQTINLAAGENLFMLFFNESSAYPLQIVGGNFNLAFSSRALPSRVWAITLYDLFKLVVKEMNALASTSVQKFDFGADSNLLKQNLDLVITSGDALRASTDPNYYQYYNAATVNANNPNNSQYNQIQSLGACIKVSLRDLFDFTNCVFGAALSNQIIGTNPESLFIEKKAYVFDPSVTTMTLGEVNDFTIDSATEYFWNWLKIGYSNPQLDEKQGKFEYNTTAQWQAPIKTIPKVLDMVTKWNTSSYLVEYTRYNLQGGKSTTFNNNDNSVFALKVDYNSFVYDFYSALFLSTLTTTTNANNTNIRLLANVNQQALFLPTIDGEFFVNDNAPAIFVFNQPISAVNYTVIVSFQILLNGLVSDSATIKMWINGTVVQVWSQNITGTNTAFNNGATFNHAFSLADSIWFTIDTTISCIAQIDQFSINVGAGYFICQSSGVNNVAQNSIEQLIPLSDITATQVPEPGNPSKLLPVITYGFQYFRYIDIISNNDFLVKLTASALITGPVTENATFFIYKNGQVLNQFAFSGTTSQSNPSGESDNAVTFALYDLVWVLASAGNMNAQITNAKILFTSKGIKAFSLDRPAYQNVSGIPNPTTAFNIEGLTPKRMLINNGDFLRATLNQIPGQLVFQTLDKNQFLSTTLNGVTVTENQNVNISDLPGPLFLPYLFTFWTEVPINFSDLLADTANGHIQFSYLGKLYYGFPIEVTQKPSLNEKQQWKLLASPLNNPADFVDLNYDGLPPTLQLMAGEIFISYTCPLKFVPLNQVQSPKYNFIHMDSDWFINQVNFWTFKQNYFQKWQSSDVIPIQIITNGVASANLQVYSCSSAGQANLVTTIGMNVISPAPLETPYIVLQANIDITALGLTSGQTYYVVIQAGSASPCIAEGFVVAPNWPVTMLAEFSNSVNKQSVVFNNQGGNIYTGAFRFEGWLDEYEPGAKFTTYENQPADISLLNAIRYRTFKLNVSGYQGVPDWVVDLLNNITLLDTVTIDGKQLTRDEGAKWEVTKTDRWPRRYWSLKMREAINKTGVTFSSGGAIEENPIVTASIDLNAFGNNPQSGGPNLIQVSES